MDDVETVGLLGEPAKQEWNLGGSALARYLLQLSRSPTGDPGVAFDPCWAYVTHLREES